MSGTDIRYAATASHDCEVVLPWIFHFSAMADYEGSDIDSQLLCDEIALLELYVPFPFIIHSKSSSGDSGPLQHLLPPLMLY